MREQTELLRHSPPFQDLFNQQTVKLEWVYLLVAFNSNLSPFVMCFPHCVGVCSKRRTPEREKTKQCNGSAKSGH